MQPDNELLHQYATTGSEEAFTELVRRHVNLVYSAALRQTSGDTHLAHDVAQSVFTDLARKAGSLLNRDSLSGWLYTSAYFAANKMMRVEIRRRQREERFMREPAPENTPETDWAKLRPLLDAAMHSLKESDREAILLRYFENRPYAEVGAKFGLNENAARLRVERALEKLRALIAKRAITTTAGLAAALSANAIQIAPGSLATNLAHASITGAAAGQSAPLATVTKIRLAVGAIVLVSAITALVARHHPQKQLFAKNEALARSSTDVVGQDASLSATLMATSPIPENTTNEEQEPELLKWQAPAIQSSSNNSPEAAVPGPVTNQPQDVPVDVIKLLVKIEAVPSMQMPKLSSGWAPAGNGAIISSEQYERIGEAVSENGGVQLAVGPALTTGSGYPAESANVKSVSVDGTNANIYIVLGALPSFNSSVFTLNVLMQLNPLYENPSQPQMQFLQVSNQFHVFPDQSAVLETDIPSGGWLFNALSLPEGQYKLLVFIKPTLMPSKVIWKIPFHHADPKSNSFSYGTSPFE